MPPLEAEAPEAEATAPGGEGWGARLDGRDGVRISVPCRVFGLR